MSDGFVSDDVSDGVVSDDVSALRFFFVCCYYVVVFSGISILHSLIAFAITPMSVYRWLYRKDIIFL